MNNIKPTPKWLKILISILFAWSTFMVTFALVLVIAFIPQNIIGFEIEGTDAIILLVITLALAIFAIIKVNKWQKAFLEKKSLLANILAFIIILLISMIFAPAPMVFTAF